MHDIKKVTGEAKVILILKVTQMSQVARNIPLTEEISNTALPVRPHLSPFFQMLSYMTKGHQKIKILLQEISKGAKFQWPIIYKIYSSLTLNCVHFLVHHYNSVDQPPFQDFQVTTTSFIK